MRGVVLHVLRYKEDSLIADIFTERYGTVPFLVRVPRQRKPTLRTQLLRPLNILELTFDMRQTQSLQRLKEMHVAVPYASLPYEPVKETLALFLSEVLRYALRHEASNEPLMEFLLRSLRWLDDAQGAVSNFHIVFLLQLTHYLGIQPDLQDADGTQYFDFSDGCLRPQMPLQGYSLVPDEARLLPLLLRLQYRSMHLLRLSREQRVRILDLIILYYRLHVAEFPELKSLAILHEVW